MSIESEISALSELRHILVAMEHHLVERSLFSESKYAYEREIIHANPQFAYEFYEESDFSKIDENQESRNYLERAYEDDDEEVKVDQIVFKDSWESENVLIGQYPNSDLWYVIGFEKQI